MAKDNLEASMRDPEIVGLGGSFLAGQESVMEFGRVKDDTPSFYASSHSMRIN